MVEAPTKEISVADILMGSVGITGLFLLGAALFGFALGGALILFKRWQAAHQTDERRPTLFQLTGRRARSPESDATIRNRRRSADASSPNRLRTRGAHTSARDPESWPRLPVALVPDDYDVARPGGAHHRQ